MILRLESLEKRFGETAAVSDLSLDIAEGEFLTLLGPSGCGKTTTLRMIAGFETPTSGRILLRDRDITRLTPQQRGVGMVFQNYALFPHLNVFENVAFGLRAQGISRSDVPTRVERALERVDLSGYSTRKVQALSGGQQQRVALARALAPEPPVLLLDEPLSNLDAALRERTRTELRTLLKRVGITSVFVTHDQEEAFALSDRIALLSAGRLQQLGTPEALYGAPVNAFVASFLGRANFLPACVVERNGDVAVCEIRSGVHWHARVMASTPGARLQLMVRPEALRLLPAGQADRESDLDGTVVERRFAGASTLYRVDLGGAELLVAAGGDGVPGVGVEGRVRIRLVDGAAVYAFPESTL